MKMKPIAAAKDAEHIKDESIGAREQPFLVAERHHHLRSRLIQKTRNGNKFEAFGAKSIDHAWQRFDGVAAVAAAVMHQDDIALSGCGIVRSRAGQSCPWAAGDRRWARPNRADQSARRR